MPELGLYSLNNLVHCTCSKSPSLPSVLELILCPHLCSRKYTAMNILKGNDEKKEIQADELTLENLEAALANDTKVKLAGLDVDGLLPSLSLSDHVIHN